MDKNNIYLASKPRYEILDGLRGVAAMIIVAYHLFETYAHSPLDQHFNHGYLAVDFFFVLSGFVIGYAYDDRWDRMSTWNFFKRRLVRLHPMVIFGSFVGMLFFYFTGCDSFPLVDHTPWYIVLGVFAFCCTMIPLPASWDIRGWAETNPLDGPVWSLQWEYLANILYALVLRRLSKLMLGICVAFFAVMTITLCFNIDVLGVLSARSGAAFTVIGGWSLTPDQLQIGLTRLLYPFFMGLLLSRLLCPLLTKGFDKQNEPHHLCFRGPGVGLNRGFYWCSIAVAALLIMPRLGGSSQMWMNGAYEAVTILVMFPLIVAVGASSQVTGRRSVSLCKFFGEISYPLYITHFPLVYLQKAWLFHHPDAPLGYHVAVSVCVFILAILNAWAAYKLYDLPVRAWLRTKLFKPSK